VANSLIVIMLMIEKRIPNDIGLYKIQPNNIITKNTPVIALLIKLLFNV